VVIFFQIMKNKLLLAAVKLLQKKRECEGRRILVITTTALGDTLWATPSLQSLRMSFPDSYIAVLTNPLGEQVLRHNPWTNDIFLLEEWFNLWRKRRSFSDIVLLHASQRFILPLASLLGATRIVGTAGINKGLDQLLTDALNNRQEHEIVRRLQLIERIGAKRHSETLSFFLQPEEKIAPQPNTIALHPGSKDPFKRWPKEHFIAVGQALAKRGFQIVITGTKEELALCEEIAQAIPGAKRYADVSLRSFAAFLASIDLLISNDTGPVHLACALKRPVIALYSSTNPNLCGPHRAKNALAIARPPTCTPCLKRACARPFCFLQIGPEEVVNAAKKMLN
jgi:heptosyltransferase-1/heptosyltransferase-2